MNANLYRLISLVAGVILPLLLGLLTYQLYSWWYGLGTLLILGYWSRGGYISIPYAHWGILQFFERPLEEGELPAAIAPAIDTAGYWWVPWPFSISLVSAAEQNTKIDPTGVQTKDNTPVVVHLAIRWKIIQPLTSLQVENLVGSPGPDGVTHDGTLPHEIDAAVRKWAMHYNAKDDPTTDKDDKKSITKQTAKLFDFLNGKGKAPDGGKPANLARLAKRDWGVKIIEFQVGDIDLPAALQDAMTEEAKEEAERRSRRTESDGMRDRALALVEASRRNDPPGQRLSFKDALAAIQAQEGHIDSIKVEGGGELTAAAALFNRRTGGGNEQSRRSRRGRRRRNQDGGNS